MIFNSDISPVFLLLFHLKFEIITIFVIDVGLSANKASCLPVTNYHK